MNVFDLEAVIRLNKTAYEQGLKDAKKQMEDVDKHTQQKTSSMSNSWGVMAVAIGNIVANAFGKVTSTINSALDGAISRVDILNNYSIVMEGLGYSADDAKRAVNKLSDGIQGLPTTLPGIVTVQKQFVPLLGSMDKATDLTLALNNAVTAGGQGQEVANSALNQWYQILANGKPDLQSWRIINQAMPAQLDQVAKSLFGTTATTQDLFDAWAGKDGAKFSITTQEIMDMMIKLSKEGGDGFASFEQQALNSSKGIQTSMTNVKTAVVTQLGNIIQKAMDSGLDLAGIFDTMKQGIRDFGKSVVKNMDGIDFTKLSNRIKNLFRLIFDALAKVDWNKIISDIVKHLTNLVDFITRHFKGILTLVKLIAAAFIGWKIGSVIQNIANGVKGLVGFMKNLVGAIKGVKGAQDALNTSMNANPIGLIVSLIATLIAIMPDLVNQLKEWMGWTDPAEVFKERIEDIKIATDEARIANEDMVNSLKDGWNDADANAQVLQNYIDMLGECVDENGNLKEGEEARAEMLLGKLNEALGTEYSLNDLLNGQYQEMTDNIKALIEQQRLKALMSVLEEQNLEAIKNQKQAYEDMLGAADALNIMEQTRASLGGRANKEIEDTIASLKAQYEQCKTTYEGYVETEAVYNQALADSTNLTTDQQIANLERYMNGMGMTGEAHTRFNDMMTQNQDIALAHYLQQLGFTEQQAGDILSNAEWSYENLSKVEDTALKNMLSSMGYNTGEIKKLMSGLTDNMDLEEKLKSIGQNGANSFGASFTSQWNYQSPSLLGNFTSFVDGIKKKLGIASPSKVFKSIGKFSAQGFDVGFDDEFDNVKDNVYSQFDDLKNYDFGELSASANMKANLDLQKQMNGFADAVNMNMDKLANMQIVLDSGVLVGETASKMDKALGSIAVKNDRVVLA